MHRLSLHPENLENRVNPARIYTIKKLASDDVNLILKILKILLGWTGWIGFSKRSCASSLFILKILKILKILLGFTRWTGLRNTGFDTEPQILSRIYKIYTMNRRRGVRSWTGVSSPDNQSRMATIHKIRKRKRQLLWHVNAAPVGCDRLIATDEETTVVAR